LGLGVLLLGACGSSGGENGTGGSGSGGATGGMHGQLDGGTGGATGSGGEGGGTGATGGSAGGKGGGTGGLGGKGGGTGGGTGGSAGAFVPAAHPSLPVVLNLGGSVNATPKVQLIAYASDSGLPDIEAFLQELTKTTYWRETTSEYGVGALTVLPTIRLSSTPPATITDADLQTKLLTNTSGANPPWGVADSHTIFLFVFPPGTIESTDPTSKCCSAYDGYHSGMQTGTAIVPYAIGCACPGYDGPNVTDIQERTVAISHELVEATTDPLPGYDTAYGQEDDNDIVWTAVSGGETADMCEFNDDSNVVPSGSKYMVQRTWSNAAAALMQNPCVPHTASTIPYFNSYPTLTQIPYNGGTTMGVNIPIGQSKTIDVKLSSTAATPGAWNVTVYDYDQILVGASSPYLGLSLDKASGRNGDTLRLTITPHTADPTLGGEAFFIYSEYGTAGSADFQSNLTMGLVTN
jgi:hypothetical protein